MSLKIISREAWEKALADQRDETVAYMVQYLYKHTATADRAALPTLGTFDSKFRTREDAAIAQVEANALTAATNIATIRELCADRGIILPISEMERVSQAIARQARDQDQYA